MPKKVERGALRAALAQKLPRDGHVVVVDALAATEGRTRNAVAILRALGVSGGEAVIVDIAVDELSARLAAVTCPGVTLCQSVRLTARDGHEARVVRAGRDGKAAGGVGLGKR